MQVKLEKCEFLPGYVARIIIMSSKNNKIVKMTLKTTNVGKDTIKRWALPLALGVTACARRYRLR